MVRYHGRARQRTGAVNRIQPGLKMAGLLGTVRTPISSWRIQQRRVRPSGVGCTNTTKVSSGTAGLGKRRVFDKKMCVTCVNNTTTAGKPIIFLALAAPASRQCAGGVNRHYPIGSCARKSSSSSTPPIPPIPIPSIVTPVVTPLPPPPGTNITLTLDLDIGSSAPPSASGTGQGYVGANIGLGYGIITPLPARSQGTNVLGQTNSTGNSICYQYDNATGNNVFIIEAEDEDQAGVLAGVIPFTTITLTNSITSDSVTYNYADTDTYPPSQPAFQISWSSGNNDPNFQWWIDAYSNAINYPSVPSIYITVTP